MLLQEAKQRAAAIVDRLKPNCKEILVVGSIRRKKPAPADIDILLIPSEYLLLHAEILKLGVCMADGPLLSRIVQDGVQVDIYYATPETWGTLVLIRTGSAENNKRLCFLAKRKGLQLKANGEGLLDSTGKRLAGDTEEQIFSALGLRYMPPEQRA
jgi:DNA polymerase (family 10)